MALLALWRAKVPKVPKVQSKFLRKKINTIDMKVVAMVPIKLNSERVKEKNLRPFHDGKPLVQFILVS